MKILIAEDDRVSRIVLTELLTKNGHEVIAVENGQLAWDLFSSHPVPMLISDWMMPVMDGLELCRRIRAEKRASYTYVILLTALSGKANYLEGMQAGADDFVVKPFDVRRVAGTTESRRAHPRFAAGGSPASRFVADLFLLQEDSRRPEHLDATGAVRYGAFRGPVLSQPLPGLLRKGNEASTRPTEVRPSGAS